MSIPPAPSNMPSLPWPTPMGFSPATRMTPCLPVRMGATMESLLTGYSDPRLSYMFNPAVKDGKYHGIRTGIPITNVALYTDPFSTLNVATTTPIRWMSAAEMHFLRAEGALRGWNMGGTAQSLYETGIQT